MNKKEKASILMGLLAIITVAIPIGGNYYLSVKTYEISSDNTMVSFANYHGGNAFKEPYYTYEALPKEIILRNTNGEYKQQLYFKEIIGWNNNTVIEHIHGPFELNYWDTDRVIQLFVSNVTINLI